MEVEKFEIKVLLTESQITALLDLLNDSERSARELSDQHYNKAHSFGDFLKKNGLHPWENVLFKFDMNEGDRYKYKSWLYDELYDVIAACLYEVYGCDFFECNDDDFEEMQCANIL